MTSALNSYGEYAQFIFNLLANRSTIERHTIGVYTKSQTIGISRGRVVFRTGHVLRVFEQVDFVTHRIISYFYELTLTGEPLWWYDSMPHPDVEELQSSHPHHKHIPPNIKHHRVATADISFTRPNLTVLIEEIEKIVT